MRTATILTWAGSRKAHPPRHGGGRAFSAASPATPDPLRILFCGTDEFSCASLDRLAEDLRQREGLVEAIDVVVRPAKPFGRGLRMVRQVPLRARAQHWGLAVHERDTFTGWTPPLPFNLIVAVSFGLFVPPRLLRAAKYGGVNVHPSLLPDLRGPAPIHHALLSRYTHTGVTVQTLDERAFDRGAVLAQTPRPGIQIAARSTVAELTARLAPVGAELLIRTLREGLHARPRPPGGGLEDAARRDAEQAQPVPLLHAAKLGPADRMIRWDAWTAEDVLARDRVLGSLWGLLEIGPGQTVRVLVADLEEVFPGIDPDPERALEQGYFRLGDLKWAAAPGHPNAFSSTSPSSPSSPSSSSPSSSSSSLSSLLSPTSAPAFVTTTVWAGPRRVNREIVCIRMPADGRTVRIGRVKMEGKAFGPARLVLEHHVSNRPAGGGVF